MINENEAIERAWELVRRENLRVRQVRFVRKTQAPTFLPDWTSRGQVWQVVFDLDIPPDRVMSPDTLEIIVDQETGEAAGVDSL
jgi:hypothetical protein